MYSYHPTTFRPFLESGESVPLELDQESILGDGHSAIIPIASATRPTGQSVLLDMQAEGHIPPVRIVHPEAVFTVRTVRGLGTLFVQPPDSTTVRRVRLRSGRSYALHSGQSYGYVPKGATEWTVRDDSSIAFEPSFEEHVAPDAPDRAGGRVFRAINAAVQRRNS